MTIFACLHKLPVILKILKKKGGDGLSTISVYLGKMIIDCIYYYYNNNYYYY